MLLINPFRINASILILREMSVGIAVIDLCWRVYVYMIAAEWRFERVVMAAANQKRCCGFAGKNTYRSGRAVDGGAEGSSRAVEQVGHGDNGNPIER